MFMNIHLRTVFVLTMALFQASVWRYQPVDDVFEQKHE